MPNSPILKSFVTSLSSIVTEFFVTRLAKAEGVQVSDLPPSIQGNLQAVDDNINALKALLQNFANPSIKEANDILKAIKNILSNLSKQIEELDDISDRRKLIVKSRIKNNIAYLLMSQVYMANHFYKTAQKMLDRVSGEESFVKEIRTFIVLIESKKNLKLPLFIHDIQRDPRDLDAYVKIHAEEDNKINKQLETVIKNIQQAQLLEDMNDVRNFLLERMDGKQITPNEEKKPLKTAAVSSSIEEKNSYSKMTKSLSVENISYDETTHLPLKSVLQDKEPSKARKLNVIEKCLNSIGNSIWSMFGGKSSSTTKSNAPVEETKTGDALQPTSNGLN